MAAQVTINEGVLWVGGEAYPLRNISHVGQRMVEVDKGAAWKEFFVRTLVWLFFGGIFAAIVDVVGVILFLGVLGFGVGRLVNALQRPRV